MTSSGRTKVTDIRSAGAAKAAEIERSRIVDSAIDELALSGPHLFSMETVATRCDLSPETISKHFNERSLLLREVTTQISSTLVNACAHAMETNENYVDRLLAICQVHFDVNVSPARSVAVWTLYSGSMTYGTEYQVNFAEADKKIFDMVRECTLALGGPDKSERYATDIAHGIFGSIDRHWIEQPIRRGNVSLFEYYETSFQSVKTVIKALFPEAFGSSDTPTRQFAYQPDPKKYDQVVVSLIDYVDQTHIDDVTRSGFEHKYGFSKDEIEANGRTWDDLLVSSVHYIAELLDHEDLESKLHAGDDPIEQLKAIVEYDDASNFTANRALWWYHVANLPNLFERILEVDDKNDRFFLQLVTGPLQKLSQKFESPADIHSIAKTLLAIKNESWLCVNSEMTSAEFSNLRKRDTDNCIALLASTMRHSFSEMTSAEDDTDYPASHRERIYNAVAMAVMEHGLWGFTYADLTRHTGLDVYRIRRLFSSKRQIVSEALGWYLDKHVDYCEEVLNDNTLSSTQAMAFVCGSFFRDDFYQSHILSLWNWTWMEAQSDDDLEAIINSADDAIVNYLMQAICRVDDSLDELTTSAIAKSFFGLSDRCLATTQTVDRDSLKRVNGLDEMLSLLQLFFPSIYGDWEPAMLLGENATAEQRSVSNVHKLDLSVENSVKRRDAIIEKTIELISRGGVSALSFPSLAEESGIALNAIQFHFPSTRGLLVNVLQHMLAEMDQEREDALAQVSDDPEIRIATIVKNEIDGCRNFPTRSKANAALYSEAITDPMLAPIYRDGDNRVADMLSVEMNRLAEINGIRFEPTFAAIGLRLGLEKIFDQADAMQDRMDFEIHLETGLGWAFAYLRNFFPAHFKDQP